MTRPELARFARSPLVKWHGSYIRATRNELIKILENKKDDIIAHLETANGNVIDFSKVRKRGFFSGNSPEIINHKLSELIDDIRLSLNNGKQVSSYKKNTFRYLFIELINRDMMSNDVARKKMKELCINAE